MTFLAPDSGGGGVPMTAPSTPDAPATPPLLGAPQGTKPGKKSSQTSFLDPKQANANPRRSATGSSAAGAPQAAFGQNTLLGQA